MIMSSKDFEKCQQNIRIISVQKKPCILIITYLVNDMMCKVVDLATQLNEYFHGYLKERKNISNKKIK